MGSQWNTCGPDTLHITFKEGPQRTPTEFSALLGEFQKMHGLPTNPLVRDKGLSGFASAAVDKAAGLRLDWTRASEEGANRGFFCLQVKGAWFESADGETQADFLQLCRAYGEYRVTRIDFQQTTRTTEHLTPYWIDQFEAGRFRVVGRKHYEPRGRKDSSGEYPLGATLYHGSRSSERFARQYDKHLQAEYGPRRRRDEVELKGQTARDIWDELQQQLIASEQLGTARGVTLASYSRSAIRAFLPIRDVTPWLGKELPRKWTEMAEEPTTWATLFDDEPLQVKPRERRVSGLLKSYRYATQNFGAAISAMAIVRRGEIMEQGCPDQISWPQAFLSILDECVVEANADRVKEFLMELPPEVAMERHAEWLAWQEQAKKNQKTEENNRM